MKKGIDHGKLRKHMRYYIPRDWKQNNEDRGWFRFRLKDVSYPSKRENKNEWRIRNFIIYVDGSLGIRKAENEKLKERVKKFGNTKKE